MPGGARVNKTEFAGLMREIEKSNRIWQGKAAVEIRRLYRAALQEMLHTGYWNDAELQRKFTEIFNGGAFAACAKAEALVQKFYIDSVTKKHGIVTPDAYIPYTYWTQAGKKITLPRIAGYRRELSGSVWRTEEAKARAMATVNFGRSVGMDTKEISKTLNLLCEPQGGKKVAQKMGRLFRVKDREGEIIESRWKEGWERDWREQAGIDVPFSKDPDSDYQKLLDGDDGWRRKDMDEFIKRHGHGARGQKVVPKAHRDFVKRLGSRGIDYRAARIARTESQAALNETIREIGTGPLASGKFEVVLAQHRDAFRCGCEAIARDSKGGVTLEELARIAEKHGEGNREPPWHPNCECWLQPVPLSAEEIARRSVAEYGGFDNEGITLHDADNPDADGLGQNAKGDTGDASTVAQSSTNIWNEQKIAETLMVHENRIKGLDHEEGVIIGRNGEHIQTVVGTEQKLEIDTELVKGNIVTHNHPSGCCALSLNDVDAIIPNDGEAVRTVTKDGRFVQLRKAEGENKGSQLATEFKKEVPSGQPLTLKAIEKVILRYGDNYTYDQYIEALENTVNQWFIDNAHKFGYTFSQGWK